ncbi:Electron transfer flavoprotein beta subunit lysine methyltransferase [Dirofilaria immitis]
MNEAFIETKGKCGKTENESAAIEGEKKSLEDLNCKADHYYGKGSKGSQRVVVATVTNDGIRAVYMMCKEVRRRRITFGVQTLAGNVENIQHAVDPIFEHISYMVNYESEKLIAGKWGKPIVLLWMERIADLFNRNSIKHQSGRIVMETEAGVFTDKWKVIQDRGCRKRK